MSALGVPRALSKATARCIAQVGRSTPVRASLPKAISTPLRTNVAPRRLLSTSPRCPVGLMPETDEPKPKEQTEEVKGLRPTHLKDEEYQLRADECMDAIHEKAEQMQESRNDVEVEFSAGVLSLQVPPHGTYVINKQPPNKQIWLASPVSGPYRYDWVVLGEGMQEKEGSGVGDWMYVRDGSRLSELLRKELGITLNLPGHEEHNTPSKDPTE